jgi:hypothetical protein
MLLTLAAAAELRIRPCAVLVSLLSTDMW